jgi:soluble lytic murein transglycosylase-like protein
MRKRLQLALMAIPVIATSFSLTPYVQAQTGASTRITPSDENGRKIYVNDVSAEVPAKRSTFTATPRRSSLVYWSSTEHRWKPVPSANGATMKAARSAAAEVDQYLGQESNPELRGANFSSINYSRGRTFTAEQIDAAIAQSAARHNVDANLVRSVVKVESNFNPNAVSRKGAMGLMQLMPGTARSLNVTNPFDPEQNVDAGVRHLKKLLESFGGDIKLSLAAYNAGAGAVARSAGIPRFAETQNYVRRITNIYYGGSDPGSRILGNPVLNPVRVQRDARGVLYISNTD